MQISRIARAHFFGALLPSTPMGVSAATFVPPIYRVRHGAAALSVTQNNYLEKPTLLGKSQGSPSITELTAASSIATRRSVVKFLGGILPFLSRPLSCRAAASQAEGVSAVESPLADLPMRRLKLPRAAVGREYVLVKLTIDGKGPFDFMVDSGLTTELITPHLQQTLGIWTRGGRMISGLAAGGDTAGGALVELKGASLCCGEFSDVSANGFPLPSLHAIVTDFPQEHLDPAHDPVEGMLGMELLDLFDVDFDFPKGRLRLWKPGTAAGVAAKAGMVEIPAAVLNGTGLLGIRVASVRKAIGTQQPFVGVIDCGAAFSTVNWAAAELLGLPPRGDAGYNRGPFIMGVGVDGRPMPLPIAEVPFTFCGDSSKDTSGRVQFAPPPELWRLWDAVKVGVGDLPVFSSLLGDGRTPFSGHAAIIGLDVLSQRRVILETGPKEAKTSPSRCPIAYFIEEFIVKNAQYEF